MSRVVILFLLFIFVVFNPLASAEICPPRNPIDALNWPYSEGDAFEVREGSGHPLRPLASSYRYPDIKDNQELKAKFDTFLACRRCVERGAGDCVLMMFLWSDISPDDPRLIRHLRALEDAVKADSPMPKPFYTGAGRDDYDKAVMSAGLRKIAYLRSKLASILAAPSLWPPNSLASTLHQITAWRRNHRELFGRFMFWEHFDDGSGRSELEPWLLLSPRIIGDADLQAAFLAEVSNIDDDEGCDVYKQWVQDLPPDFRASVTEKVIKKMGKSRRCAQKIH